MCTFLADLASLSYRAHGEALLGASFDTNAALNANVSVDRPGFGCSVNFDCANGALSLAETTVDAVVTAENAFFNAFFKAEALLGTLVDTHAALNALFFVESPGLAGSVNGESAFGTGTNTETAVYTVVAAGELACNLLLEVCITGDEIFGIFSYHVIVFGQADSLGGAEVLAHSAESAGSQVKLVSDVLAAFYFFYGSGDGHRRADLDAHAAVYALAAVVLNTTAVVGSCFYIVLGEITGAGLGEQVGGGFFQEREFETHLFIASLFCLRI